MRKLFFVSMSLILLTLSTFGLYAENAEIITSYSSDLDIESVLSEIKIGEAKNESSQLTTKAIYLSGSIVIAGEQKVRSFLDRFQNAIDEKAVNTVILDIKENSVMYFKLFSDLELDEESRNANLVKLMKSLTHSRAPKISNTLEIIKEYGLRVVARVVVMKDKKIARLKPSWALKSRVTGKTWGNLNWLNPWSKGLKEFYYEMAIRLANEGIDEIQLDYIRMPGGEDGSSKDRFFPGRKTDRLCEGIPKFLKGLKDKLKSNKLETLIGVDVFGYIANGKNYCSGVGQHLGLMGKYIDVVWPMQYPSHWAVKNQKGFGTYHPESVPRKIYRITTKNIRKQFEEADSQRIKVIPWVQAFYLKRFAGVTMQDPKRGELNQYVTKQLNGIIEGGGDGFALWGTPTGQVNSVK